MNSNLEQILEAKGVSGSNFFDYQGKTYFAGNNGEIGSELWVSDGTTEGTQLFLEINPTFNEYYNFPNASYPAYFTEYNDLLYFTANEQESGRELWVTDGTIEGTQLVADIFSGSYTSPFSGETRGYDANPSEITEFDGKLYFVARDEENGEELWVTDGTTEGTQLVADISPGNTYQRSLRYGYISVPVSSYPIDLTVFNGKLYFAAEVFGGLNIPEDEAVEITGRELWVTDGTTEGTQLVADINPGAASAFSRRTTNLSVVGDELLFTANNGETEQEYRVTLDGTVEPVNGSNPDEPNEIEGTLGNDTIAGTDGRDIIRGRDGTDTLNGGAGDDTLFGDNRQDRLVGGAGNDSLIGGSGDDTLDGGMGDDTLLGQGNDFFVLREGDGTDVILDYREGSDRFFLFDGLTREDLSFSGSDILVGDEVLATVNNVNTSSLRPFNFIEI